MSTTDSQNTQASTATSEIASGAAQFLTPVVIDLEAIVVDGKQAHWNTRGASFIGIHQLLDDVVEHAQEFADTAAERVIALGLPVDARLRTVAEKTTVPALTDGFQQWEQTVAETVAQLDAALVTIRAAIKGLDEVDLASQDVAIEIERGVAKDRWLLAANIAG